MILKYMINALATLQSATNMEQVIFLFRKEFSKLVVRIFMGTIFVGIIIVSLFQLGSLYQDWLKQFENGFTIGVISYSSLIVICSLVLYFLFGEEATEEAPKLKALSEDPSPDQPIARGVQVLALKFAEGFIEGYEKH